MSITFSNKNHNKGTLENPISGARLEYERFLVFPRKLAEIYRELVLTPVAMRQMCHSPVSANRETDCAFPYEDSRKMSVSSISIGIMAVATE